MTFRDEGVQLSSGTLLIEAMDPKMAGSQEYQFYARALAQKFSSLGLTLKQSAPADYVAKLGFGLKRREAETRGSNHHLHLSSSIGFSGHGYGAGVIIDGDKDTVFEFERAIKIVVSETEGDKARSVMEVSALSVGKCNSLPKVYPQMLEAIFQNLHRNNASNIIVKLPATPGPCASSQE